MGKLHLVRHAHYPLLDTKILAGRMAGHDLDARGRAQAARLAERLADEPVARILSGPLARARQTAAAIAAARGLPVTPDARLDELDYGDWTGLRWDTLDTPAWRLWNAARSRGAIPNGETAQAVADRAMACAREAAREGDAVLVTHADVVRAILGTALRMSADHWLALRIDPASRSVLTLHPDGPDRMEILAVNLP